MKVVWTLRKIKVYQDQMIKKAPMETIRLEQNIIPHRS